MTARPGPMNGPILAGRDDSGDRAFDEVGTSDSSEAATAKTSGESLCCLGFLGHRVVPCGQTAIGIWLRHSKSRRKDNMIWTGDLRLLKAREVEVSLDQFLYCYQPLVICFHPPNMNTDEGYVGVQPKWQSM